MTDLNAEWVQSIIKLGLIEDKKSVLATIGEASYEQFTYRGDGLSDLAALVREYAALDALLRDEKATFKMAEVVVKASRK